MTAGAWRSLGFRVAPHAGAWIETTYDSGLGPGVYRVAPHAGAWIETYKHFIFLSFDQGVAPHAGAWIETPRRRFIVKRFLACRTPCGCVD